MIENIRLFESGSHDPYYNLAVEQHLLETVAENTCILYLWQNQNTVVIGKNQNAWKECRTTLLEEEGGHLARRLSGGGAVFHDLGNLNFTFLMPQADYDLDRQLTVIAKNLARKVKSELASLLESTSVVYGDCSNQSLLNMQGIAQVDALLSLTGMDETNMIISLYAGSRGVNQIITKLSRAENTQLGDAMNLGSMICPRELCSNNIVQYVRAMQNQTGAAVSVHTIADGQVEAVEFLVDSSTKNCGIPLKQLKLKSNILLASITRGVNTEIPGGDSTFQEGDTVVVVTDRRGILKNVNDIFA